MVLFKYVTHTGIVKGTLHGTTSQQNTGQMQQLKLCADNWAFYIHVCVYILCTYLDCET